MNRYRLTEAEIQAVFDRPGGDTDDDWAFHQAVADAATEKALRQVLTWLRRYKGNYTSDSVRQLHETRGYGEWLEDAADELARLLEGA